jgi:uncharacterized peroxidase-related enzyme
MAYLPSLPHAATLLDVFKEFPETNKPLIEFHEVLMRGPSPFSDAERELIAAYVSGLNRCHYCCGVHTATTERLGTPEGAVAALLDELETAAVPARMKPVLAYAQKLTRAPDSVTQGDAEAVLAEGWDQTALYHTVAVTALFNYMNRLVEGLGIELEPDYVEPASKRLAERGYLPLIDLMMRR